MTGIIINNQERAKLLKIIRKALGRTYKTIDVEFEEIDLNQEKNILYKPKDVYCKYSIVSRSGQRNTFSGKVSITVLNKPYFLISELAKMAGCGFGLMQASKFGATGKVTKQQIKDYVCEALFENFKNIYIVFQNEISDGKAFMYGAIVQNMSGDVIKFQAKADAIVYLEPWRMVGDLAAQADTRFARIGLEQS